MLRRCLTLLTLLVSLYAIPAFASSRCEGAHGLLPVEHIAELYNFAFKLPEMYRPGQCGRNTKTLMSFLTDKGVNLRDGQVLFLMREARTSMGIPNLPGQLRPAFNRGHEKSWDFHVVLRLKQEGDWIFDLDGSAKPEPAIAYFQRLFPAEKETPDRLSKITVKVIDPLEYLEAFRYYYEHRDRTMTYDENWVVGDFRLSPTGTKFPSLREVLTPSVD